MLKTILIILAFYTSAHSADGGFAKGNDLVATPVQGQVRVVCNGFNGNDTALYNCRDVALSPSPYDFFVGPQIGRSNIGDRIELLATLEDGTNRSKSTGYDGVRGKSRDAFNLWISTLFQKPLLSYGVNKIRFRVIVSENHPEHIIEGNFIANVKRGTVRTCPAAEYTSSDINDCNSQYSICQRYFQEYNNCQ
ncbi:MAG: hypothetical protein HUU57_00405 [Bdellovibrio sp.]|nr:hypothetical protein [Bdellovibrio sp.]